MTHLAPRPDKEWLTAAEAAAESLPAFAFSERQLRNFLCDGTIQGRPRAGRGGGREFHWTSLPAPARDEFLKRHGVQQNAGHDTKALPAAREAEKDLIADARKMVAEAARDFIAARKLTIGRGLKAFSAAYQRPRTIALPDWVKQAVPQAAPHQVRAWWSALKSEDGAAALRDRRGRPDGTGLFDRDAHLRSFVIARLAERPHLSASALCDAVRVDLDRAIALRTMQLFLSKLRENAAPALKLLSNPDKFRSHHQVAFGSYEPKHINERWELDATRADAMCRLPDGSTRRFALTAVIEVFTRRAIVLVSDQDSARATQALFRRAIIAWGLPDQIKTDNGLTFTARAVKEFCAKLGIAMKFSQPFKPEQKPYIERFFGTLNRELFTVLPGFVGHSVADRKGIEARNSYAHRFGTEAKLLFETTLTPEGLQARIDAWLADIYEQRPHEGIAMPPSMKALAHRDAARQISDLRILDALLLEAPRALCTVGKKGIRIANHFYIAAELGGFVGRRVRVRFDPHDVGRIVVYAEDGETFLCVAEDPDITGADRGRIAVGAHHAQRQWANRIRNDARKVQKLFPGDGLADRILKDAAGNGFALDAESRRAFDTAAAPRAIEHIRALDALQESKTETPARDATAEQRESASLVLAEFAAEASQAAERLVECDGYTRPAFAGDDIGFWKWAKTSGLTLDAQDARAIAALEADDNFQLLLSIAARSAA